MVIGAAGDMATVGVERLAARRTDCTFDLYDLDVPRVESLAARLPKGSARSAGIDLFDGSALHAAIAGADLVVLGAGPYLRTAPPVMRACIEAGVDYLDFDDDIESTQDALSLEDDARMAGVGLFIGCGASPGLANVVAVDAVDRLDEVRTVDVCWVTGDEGPRPYGAAVIQHALHMWSGTTLVWRDGCWVVTEPFVESEVFPVGGPFGDYRLYLTAHPEMITLPRRYPEVRTVRVMGGSHPPAMNGLLRGIAMAVERHDMSVADAIEWLQAVGSDRSGSLAGWRHALTGMLGQVRRGETSLGEVLGFGWDGLRRRHHPYRLGLMVRATGLCDGLPATVHLRTLLGEPASHLGSSMAAATGTSLAAFTALVLAAKDGLAGVLAPEDWVEPSELYRALEDLGVPREEIVPTIDVDRGQ